MGAAPQADDEIERVVARVMAAAGDDPDKARAIVDSHVARIVRRAADAALAASIAPSERARRAQLWAAAEGEHLLAMAERIGVGRVFCRDGKLPTYADPGLAEQIEASPLPAGGLFISGPVGTHKTHLLCARAVDAVRRGYTAEIVGWQSFLREVRETYGESRGRSASEATILRRYAKLDYLGIDDLAVGRMEARESEHAVVMAYALLDARYQAGRTRVTDVTTNLLIDELAARFDARIARRVREICTVYPMLASD